MNKAEIVFKEELNDITSKGIRSFVLKCFEELTPDYFWDGPASSSYKYHPRIANKEHGIVLHTKLCVWWGKQLANSFNDKNIDIIVASLLLHDLQKFGKELNSNSMPTLAEHCSTHGPVLAAQIESIYDHININEGLQDDINTIVACVALHMGIWTNKSLSLSWVKALKEEDKQLVHIVHLADYCASKKIDDKLEELDSWIMP